MTLENYIPTLKKAGFLLLSGLVGFTGNTIYNNKMDNVKEDQQIMSIQRVIESFPTLNRQITTTNKNLAVLNERLKDLMRRVNTDERSKQGH